MQPRLAFRWALSVLPRLAGDWRLAIAAQAASGGAGGASRDPAGGDGVVDHPGGGAVDRPAAFPSGACRLCAPALAAEADARYGELQRRPYDLEGEEPAFRVSCWVILVA